MAVQITVEPSPKLGFDTLTGKSLIAERIVEITEDFPEREGVYKSVYLVYTRGFLSQLVQVTFSGVLTYRDDVTVSFSIEGLDGWDTLESKHDTPASAAKRLGTTKEILRSTIRQHAPPC